MLHFIAKTLWFPHLIASKADESGAEFLPSSVVGRWENGNEFGSMFV